MLNISASIAWNLITSYDNDLPYTGRGIMGVANTPWCGDFHPYAAVWASAHTTWFTTANKSRYIGGGHLSKSGSWVALTNEETGELTIVIEKQSWEDTNHGQWKAQFFPMDYITEPEELHFTIARGGVAGAMPSKLGVWRSHFRATSAADDPTAYSNVSTNTSFLVRGADITPTRAGGFTVSVGVNEIVTVTTRVEGVPSVAPTLPASPPSCVFTRTLEDDFDNVVPGQEARYFQDMHGSFEAVKSVQQGQEQDRGMVMRQMAVGVPIGFHRTDGPPLSVVGGQAMSDDGSVVVDFLIEPGQNNGAVLGSHIVNAQCGDCGIYFTVGSAGMWSVGPSQNIQRGAWGNGTCRVATGSWQTMKLNVTHGVAHGWVNGASVFSIDLNKPDMRGKPELGSKGWVGIGTSAFGPVQFDRFVMQQ